jgi:hypothetical protein
MGGILIGSITISMYRIFEAKRHHGSLGLAFREETLKHAYSGELRYKVTSTVLVSMQALVF